MSKLLLCFSMILVMLTALVACTSTQIEATTRLTLEAKLVDILIQNGDPEDVVMTADLTDGDVNTLIRAIDTYQLVRQRWQAITENPANVAINILLLEDDYQALVVQYTAVRSVVQAHWDEYTPAQQFVLESYHSRALSLGEAVQNALQVQDRRQALSTALELGLMLARVAAV